MSEDIASIGIAVDSTQTVAGSKALDDFAKSAAGVTTNISATSNEISNYEAKVLAALQAQYGMTEAQAESIAGFKASTVALEENNLVQIQLGTNLKLNMALTKQRAAEAIAADQAMRASQTAAAAEAVSIMKLQDAAYAASYTEAMAMNKAYDANAAAALTAAAALEVNTVATVENTAANVNSRLVYESVVAARELFEGRTNRLVGTLSILGQQTGLITASTLLFGGALLLVATPLALIAAASVTGSEKLAAFNREMQLTDDYAGLTYGQFQKLADGIGIATTAGTGKAIQALNVFIASGKVANENLANWADSAVRFGQLSGESSTKAAQGMQDLVTGGVPALIKFEDQYHLLDAAFVQHIATLDETGQKELAARDLAAGVHEAIKAKGVADLGILQAAWQGFGNTIQAVWTSLENIGKSAPLEAQIAQIQSRLQPSALGFLGSDLGTSQESGDRLHISMLQAQIVENNNLAAVQAKNAQIQTDGADAVGRMAGEWKTVEKNTTMAATEVAKYKSDIAAMQAAGLTTPSQDDQDRTIAALNKKYGEHNPKTHAGPDYTDFSVQLGDYNTKLAQENSLYGVFDTLQQQVLTKSNQEIDSIEKKKDAKGHYIDVTDAEIAHIKSLTEASLEQQSINKVSIQIYDQFNKPTNDYINNLTSIEDLTNKGAITQDQATEAQKRAIKTYNDATDSLISANLVANDNLLIQQHTISTLNLETEARIRSNAEFAERIKLERDAANGIHHSPEEAQKAITGAGDTAVGANDLANANVGNQNTAGAQLANQIAADVKFNTGRVQRYAAASAQITAIAKAEGWSEQQVNQATTLLYVQNLQDRIASTDKALGEIATLTQSSNKTLAGLGKAAAIAQATIDGSLAIVKTMSGTPFPWNIPLVAAESVAVAAQIAKIASMASGGPVTGSGGPRQDNIPIMASVGEYVVNADAASKNKGLLDAINYGGAVASNRGSHFANGGMVGAANQNHPVNGTYIDFSGANFGGSDPDQIMQRVHMAISQVYGPQIVRTSVQQSLKTQSKLSSRQTMNHFASKAS